MAGRGVEFPSGLRPTRRSFQPGEYPGNIFRAQNGASVAIRFGNTPVDSRLSLTFENISDQDARRILQHYDAVNGEWDYVFFPNDGDMVSGVSDTNMSRMLRGTHKVVLKYRYAEPPSVNYVFMDAVTVTCSFIGYLDGGLD